MLRRPHQLCSHTRTRTAATLGHTNLSQLGTHRSPLQRQSHRHCLHCQGDTGSQNRVNSGRDVGTALVPRLFPAADLFVVALQVHDLQPNRPFYVLNPQPKNEHWARVFFLPQWQIHGSALKARLQGHDWSVLHCRLEDGQQHPLGFFRRD